jgi:uncharacterized cupin superfamily protein
VNEHKTDPQSPSVPSEGMQMKLLRLLIAAANQPSVYPKELHHVVEGRTKRKLGNFFGLKHFGFNHTTLATGSASALQHHHSAQDEFVYVLKGEATLIFGDNQEHVKMTAGDCMGFPAG